VKVFSKLALKKGSRAQRENLIMSEIQGEKRRSTKETIRAAADHNIVFLMTTFRASQLLPRAQFFPIFQCQLSPKATAGLD
jgi:hypothetical protein